MAIRINAGKNVRRSDVFHVEPSQVVIREELRGRRTPPGDDAILAMAVSLLDYGQLQPCIARRIKDDKVQLVAGFTRAAAARLIRDGFTDEEGQQRHDADFMLQVRIQDMNDEDAFVRNVVENCRRNETSPIDDAHNQQRLRHNYGRNDAEIARLYQCSPNKVGHLRRLLMLPNELQALVHSGKMSVSSALDMLGLPDSDRDLALKAAMLENGKVNGAEIRRQVREHHLADEGDASAATVVDGATVPDAPAPKRGHKPRTPREIKAFFADQEWADERAQKLAKAFLKYVDGKVTDKYMLGVVGEILA